MGRLPGLGQTRTPSESGAVGLGVWAVDWWGIIILWELLAPRALQALRGPKMSEPHAVLFPSNQPRDTCLGRGGVWP